MTTLLESEGGWTWSRSSLYNALHRLGFSYDGNRHNYYDRVKENEDNVYLRNRYLRYYFQYAAEGRPIVYMDETWINKNTVPSRAWHDGTSDTVDAVPPGKGERLIIIGAGSSTGWIPRTFQMWTGKKKTDDYHSEMNGAVFKKWVHERLLPNMPANGVIVLDRASYHCQITEDTLSPQQKWTKPVLAQWLLDRGAVDEKGVPFTREFLLNNKAIKKDDVWAFCYERKPKKKFLLPEWVDAYNKANNKDIRVNYLPVAHPQLNPIEMLWNWLKTDVAAKNKTFSIADIRRLATARQAELDGEWWAKACRKSHEFAEDCLEADDALFEEVENGIGSSDSEDDDDLQEVEEELEEI